MSHSKKSSSSSSSSSVGTNDGTTITNGLPQNDEIASNDELFLRLRSEAAMVVQKEPILTMLLSKVGLLDNNNLPPEAMIASCTDSNEPAKSFEEIIARIVSHHLSSCSGGTENICPKFLRHLLEESFRNNELEMGHTMSEAARRDALAILRRDPACETLLEAVLFMKGFHSLVIHRAARRAWKPVAAKELLVADENKSNNANKNMEQAKVMADSDSDSSGDKGISVAGKRFVALLLQSQASSAFGVDIHPAASIGAGVMIDHASGVVIGETATVGDGTTILHGVTLGGTGKDHGDRHPKIGKHVLIGAGTKILGNITVGDRAKIGCGSVVLRPIPSGATAVGAPAKIIGFIPRGERPGSSVDMKLEGVEPLLGKRESSDTVTTTDSSGSIAAEAMQEKKEDQDDVAEGDTEESTSNEEEDANDKEASVGEEDDNITDFGTSPKCRWVKVSSHDDGLCPFSGLFRDVTSSIKNSSISHKELRALLIQEGCTEGECVEVFFELLHCTPASSKERECGCIPLDIFSKCLPEIAKEKTKLDEDTILALVKGDLRALGMSKKASRRFKSMFNMLDKHSISTLPIIASFGCLSDLGKSEREKMSTHLDTTTYAEGIAI
eukprot:CAMPEP_0172304678 /NCGR_PEP_ID=MMETSP1058-20130122/6062_1 /TAXON_ID=83371 /ORGANISM="Detonula confervacea, Strain CCMP 353" /LENGTH=612 /DNA_ID=CAMNT_0013016021 /DNA_START=44 /DNA_END=1882 /DNA_ORIENTATION=-